jgi:hypothetical protein
MVGGQSTLSPVTARLRGCRYRPIEGLPPCRRRTATTVPASRARRRIVAQHYALVIFRGWIQRTPSRPVNAKLLPRLWGIDRRCPLRNGGNDVGSRTAPVRRRRGYDPGREPCTVRSLSAWRQIASRTATPTRCTGAIRDALQSSGVTSTELGILNSSESARCCELAHTPAAGAGLDLPPRITQWRISWERVSILATGPTNVP